MVQGILVVNTETIPGMIITETLGVVSGSTVRAKNIGRDFTQGLRNIMGGELVKYTELLEESRQEAIGRMVADAMSRGGTAIVNVRFATSAELLVRRNCSPTVQRLRPSNRGFFDARQC